MSFFEIPAEQLCWRCDPDSVGTSNNDTITAPVGTLIGQERALKALRMGLDMHHVGYNIFVSGISGVGKATLVRCLLADKQGDGVVPPDMCYVFGFQDPEQPQLLSLPPGQGRKLKKGMQELISNLKRDISRAYASRRFQHRIEQFEQQAQRREQRLLHRFEGRLRPHFGFLERQSEAPDKRQIAPIIDGQLTPSEVLEERVDDGQFPLTQYQHLCERLTTLNEAFNEVHADIEAIQYETEEAVRRLRRALVRPIIQQAVADFARQFDDASTQQYLKAVESALYEDIERFREPSPVEHDAPPVPHPPMPIYPLPMYDEDLFHEYQVNIIVDQTDAKGVPVIVETVPTFKNLFGSIEPTLEYGGMVRNDYTGIRAGSIHRANGGYLVFDARDALTEPIIWATLKRILRHGQAGIQADEQHAQAPATVLKPQSIPCNVKLIMIGDEELYDALVAEDEMFKRLFKVKVAFDTTMPRLQDTIAQYAGYIRRVCKAASLRCFDAEAAAAVIEFSVRLAGRRNKLSARLDCIADLLKEADYWAAQYGQSTVTRAVVQQTMREGARRVNLVQDKLRDMIADGLLLITTQGAVVGQVNGLSIYELEEDYLFGCPMRITAEAAMGDSGVVNIEREVELGDATHNKGVLILTGYLRRTFAQDKPLVLSASLCVEQSYEGIIGDSASAAEMYALLSSLADLPVEQGIAVTGSVNQKGELQPVSGINEKIEGFFDVCRLQGLSGQQGVILPPQNIDDLMLRDDVVEAVKAGQFRLYAVPHINDGLAILTGVQAGTEELDGGYPPDTVNGRVNAKLGYFVERWSTLRHGTAVHNEGADLLHSIPKS